MKAYTYDAMNRLTTASYQAKTDGSSWSTTNAYKEEITGYDLNGNITGLNRLGIISGSTTQLDGLSYSTYSGNQLVKVEDSQDMYGFKNGVKFFTYLWKNHFRFFGYESTSKGRAFECTEKRTFWPKIVMYRIVTILNQLILLLLALQILLFVFVASHGQNVLRNHDSVIALGIAATYVTTGFLGIYSLFTKRKIILVLSSAFCLVTTCRLVWEIRYLSPLNYSLWSIVFLIFQLTAIIFNILLIIRAVKHVARANIRSKGR